MKQIRNLILLGILLFGSSAGAWTPAQGPVHVTIMHTNDIHGRLVPRNGIGGVAEMATLIRDAKPDLLLDAGDMFTGTYLNDYFQGVPMIRAMNAMGYTAGTLGNHEFDYGQAPLRSRLREAKFPILSANVESNISEIKKYTTVTAKGIRFGIIGVTTGELSTTTHPKNLQNVRVSDVVESIQRVLPEVRRLSDFIIVTSHVTDAEDRRIANAFPEIRLIVGGHAHSTLGPIRVDETLIVKTGNVGRNVGRVDLEFDGKVLKSINGRLIPVDRIPADPEIARVLAPFESEIARKLAEVVGETPEELFSSSTTESVLGNLVADALREAGKTQIGLQNTGGIRNRIDKGPITWGEVFEVLPFQNTLVTLRLTGTQLKKILGTRVHAISGVRVHFSNGAGGPRLVSATLADGTPIDDAKTYTVTTNDFLVAGGDGLSEFAQAANIRNTERLLRDAVVEYLKDHRPITTKLDGRVRVD